MTGGNTIPPEYLDHVLRMAEEFGPADIERAFADLLFGGDGDLGDGEAKEEA